MKKTIPLKLKMSQVIYEINLYSLFKVKTQELLY